MHVSTATPTANDPDVTCRWSAGVLCEGAGAPPKDGKNGHSDRWICILKTQGPAVFIKTVDYTKKTWLTMRPPNDLSDLSKRLDTQHMKDFCERREWIKNNEWCGPQPRLFARSRKGGGKGKDKKMSKETAAESRPCSCSVRGRAREWTSREKRQRVLAWQPRTLWTRCRTCSYTSLAQTVYLSEGGLFDVS